MASRCIGFYDLWRGVLNPTVYGPRPRCSVDEINSDVLSHIIPYLNLKDRASLLRTSRTFSGRVIEAVYSHNDRIIKELFEGIQQIQGASDPRFSLLKSSWNQMTPPGRSHSSKCHICFHGSTRQLRPYGCV